MSPFVSIGDRVKSYLEAEQLADAAMLQTAINAGFGEVYSPGGTSLREWQDVARRRGVHHFGEVPVEVQKRTCAIDVGKRGIFYSIRGWGGRASSWQIESGELAGYTDSPEVWNDV